MFYAKISPNTLTRAVPCRSRQVWDGPVQTAESVEGCHAASYACPVAIGVLSASHTHADARRSKSGLFAVPLGGQAGVRFEEVLKHGRGSTFGSASVDQSALVRGDHEADPTCGAELLQ
jgi:hypothetical protein